MFLSIEILLFKIRSTSTKKYPDVFDLYPLLQGIHKLLI